jgi:hypothetical protein
MPLTIGPTINHFDKIPLGAPLSGGGHLICKNLGVALVVAPSCAEVLRNWFDRGDAITMAACCTITPASSWFVPTYSRLQTAGTYSYNWDPKLNNYYWSEEYVPYTPNVVIIYDRGSNVNNNCSWYSPAYVRAFRCITY